MSRKSSIPQPAKSVSLVLTPNSRPVVFFTGYTFNAWKCLAFDRGAVDFIDKTRRVEKSTDAG